MEWGYKPIINALIRRLALSFYFPNQKDKYRFSTAWNILHRNVKYKFGYDVIARDGKETLLNKYKENELPDVISVAVSICKK